MLLASPWSLVLAAPPDSLPPPGIYALKSDVGMEGSLELRAREGGYHAFIHLTQEETGGTCELEGPARSRQQRLVVESLHGDGAMLSLTPGRKGHAAIKGNDEAQREYCGARVTFDGNYRIVPLDDILARADAGDAAARFRLGNMYYKGYFRGVPFDEARALARFREAAAQGNADALYMLGVMYEEGQGGLTPDKAQAREWYRRAAALGHALAKLGRGWSQEEK
ncbi:hypothetical protein AGMMS50256_30210 [Betaproteobacteria bacterium]|nr:hypothetical protein AGMMS50256_30210 [Betaproteobacteria bacterium]